MAKTDARNSFTAQLISEEFVGSMVTLFFEAEGGMEVKVQVQERMLEGISREPGQQVHLSFDPSHAHVLRG
jgi:spermidine/putrescine transport system ATP-binding protein